MIANIFKNEFLKKNLIFKFMLNLRERIFDTNVSKSYSQEGEDLILRRIFGDKTDGFYVDVGAHHPTRFSNTYIFYKAGWSGINIEPNPAIQSLFLSRRRRDVMLGIGINDQATILRYYEFNDSALNTFDESLMDWRLKNTQYTMTGYLDIPVERLDTVLSIYLPHGREIDFLSIDVEGFDLNVLKSNDWQRFRPKCVLIESLHSSLQQVMFSESCIFLQSQGYELFAKTFNSLIFRLRGF